MYGIVLVSHGPLAKSFVESAKLIVGDFDCEYNGLFLGSDLEYFENEVRSKIIKQKDKYGEVVVLTDLMHGTPFNTVARMMEEIDMLHYSGVNLPILLEIITSRTNLDINKLSKTIDELAGSCIINVNDLLNLKEEV